MFILRKLFYGNGEAEENNQVLGFNYSVITEHNGQWAALYKDWGGSDKIYTFIVSDGGTKVTPLYKGQGNYIMMSDGKTFTNLTHK